MPLHYAVLRPDLAAYLNRVGQRRPGDPDDLESFPRLHARFADLGDREASVVEATGTPEEVAAADWLRSRRDASGWSCLYSASTGGAPDANCTAVFGRPASAFIARDTALHEAEFAAVASPEEVWARQRPASL